MRQENLNENPKVVANVPFEYGPIMSNYHEDNIYDKFATRIRCTIDILA